MEKYALKHCDILRFVLILLKKIDVLLFFLFLCLSTKRKVEEVKQRQIVTLVCSENLFF